MLHYVTFFDTIALSKISDINKGKNINILQTIEVDRYSSVFILNLEENVLNIDTSIIPSQQLEEINQYHQVQDRYRRLISRTFLFKYLKDNYNLSDFTFLYTDIKRPSLKDTNINFNISYSKNLIAVAISTKNKIGVDIEYIDHSFDIKSIIPACMNNKELKNLELLKDSEQLNYFYSLWTYKEALLKLIGGGLYLDLKEITDLNVNNLNISKYQPFISNDYSLSVVKFNKD